MKRGAAWVALTALLAFAGCDGNINDSTIGLAVTIRVSVDSAGGQANQGSTSPAISADGRYIAFSSVASNLVAGDTNGASDVFLHDTLLGTTTLVSISTGGGPGNGASLNPSISADGSRIAFESLASDLVALDLNAARDVFVRDMTAGTTVRASLADGGFESFPFLPTDFGATTPSISADGAYVAFVSDHTDLVFVPFMIFGLPNVFRHELATLTTDLVSVAPGSMESFGISACPSISGDGQFVAFESDAADLVAGDLNLTTDVFVRDMTAGVTERASVDTAGAEANGISLNPSITPDGSRVAFYSLATNLAPDTTPTTSDIFVRDRTGPSTTLISRNSQGLQGSGDSDRPAFSADGRYVAFLSGSNNLVTDDFNGLQDVFRHDLVTGETVRISVGTYGVEGSGESGTLSTSALSSDGRFVVFQSRAPNFVPGDTNGLSDVFFRGPLP